MNSTGGVIRSPVVSNDPGLQNAQVQKHEFPDMPDGQAWVRSRSDNALLVINGPLEFSYVDRKGFARTLSVPFAQRVPQPCHEDFFIEIRPEGGVRSGLLVYQEHADTSLESHALAVAAGLAIGCLFWRRDRHRADPPDHDGKPIDDSDMG